MKLMFMAFIALSIVFSGCSNAKKDKGKTLDKGKNDLFEKGLKGQVKSLKESTFEAKLSFDEIIKGEDYRGNFYIFHYDENGNEVEMNTYKTFGSRTQTAISKFDSKGRKIQWSLYDSVGTLNQRKIFSYDNKGNQTQLLWYNNNEIFQKWTYKFDAKGNKIEENQIGEDGEIFSKYINKHDNKGRIIEQDHLGADNIISFKSTYKYDSKGNIIEMESFSKEITFSFNEDNTSVKKDDFNFDNKKIYKYRYNEKGDKIEEIITNPFNKGFSDEITYKYEYEYDDNGNWLKKSIIKNTIPLIIEERAIQYY